MIHLDTHVVLWLADRRTDLLTPAAARAIDAEDLAVSPMVGLELDYLREIGRLQVPGREILAALAATVGLRISAAPFPAVVEAASALAWTRDPFDRLIAAQSLVDRCPLVTRDATILAHLPGALWD